jgi:hypothetical protein
LIRFWPERLAEVGMFFRFSRREKDEILFHFSEKRFDEVSMSPILPVIGPIKERFK